MRVDEGMSLHQLMSMLEVFCCPHRHVVMSYVSFRVRSEFRSLESGQVVPGIADKPTPRSALTFHSS
jgi:hypothetical protein